MSTGTSNVANTSSISSLLSTHTSKTTAPSTADAQSDRFLKLLVAQLNNQDPMNPMDNAQMTSQMAQINTVTGIQQLNDTIQSIAGQFTSMQVLQGTALIGRDVLSDGNTISIKDGVGRGAYEIPTNADSVTVQVLSPGGQLLGTINLGAQSGGRHNFDWDASNYKASGNPTFNVTATQGKTGVAAATLSRNTIESVSSVSGAMSLTLKDGSAIPYSAVKAVL